MKHHLARGLAWVALLLAITPAQAQAQTPVLGPHLEHFDYDFPVERFVTTSQGHRIEIAYAQIEGTVRPNGRTALLMHGKNFCSGTWNATMSALMAKGYRVIAIDQIGFCKSSKPKDYQYSFHALATLTRDLLDHIFVTDKVDLIGHSTGGMLAARFALLYPERVNRLILVNPLGLNDTVAEGVPYADLGTLLAEEAKTDAASIKAYQQKIYYDGQWRADYDRWVTMLAGMYAGPQGDIVRIAQARLSDMIQSQPIAAELPLLKVPTTLMIGMKDKTAFRASSAPAAIRARIRTVPLAAQEAVTRIPGAKMVRFEDLGHSPQVEDPARFHAALVEALQ